VSKNEGISAGITFFYHKDIEPAVKFYGEVMDFQLVSDQGWAKIFRIAGNSYMGVVTGKRGFYQPQEKNAVLLTVVVDNVQAWYERLRETSAIFLTEVQDKPEIQVRCFFLQDPAGYAIEIQQFLDPGTVQKFGLQ
jgi:predicted enzyme related to lactoylglutathione lyase